MSAEFFLRIIFMFILAIAGGFWGYDLSKYNPAEVYPLHDRDWPGRRAGRLDPDALLHHPPRTGFALAVRADRSRDALCRAGRAWWSAC